MDSNQPFNINPNLQTTSAFFLSSSFDNSNLITTDDSENDSSILLHHEIVQSLINKMNQEFTEKNDMSDELILSMYNVLGSTFERALHLADLSPLNIYESNELKLWQVKSSSGEWFYILPHIDYCKCESYKYQTIKQHISYTCKHYLAAEINFARKNYKIEKLSNSKEFVELLKTIFVYDTEGLEL